MLILDKYAYHNRLVHMRVSYKAIVYIIMLIIAFSGLTNLQVFFLLTCPLITCYLAFVPLRQYMKWQLVVAPFIFISFLTFVITYTNNPDSLMVSIPFAQGFLGVDKQAVKLLIPLLLRIYCSLIATYWFILTTPFYQLIALLKQLKVPIFLLDIMLLMYRFIFMFMHTFIGMKETLDLKFGFIGFKKSYHTYGLLAKNLFTNLMTAQEQLNQIMCLRFDDTIE